MYNSKNVDEKKVKLNINFKSKKVVYVVAIFMLLIALIYALNNTTSIKEEEDLTEKLFQSVEVELVDLERYIIYGTHLNMNGRLSINLDESSIDDISLVFKDIWGNEHSYDIEYNIDEDNIRFSTSPKINEGIDLENIPKGDYYVVLKIGATIDNLQTEKYYLLDNTTEYDKVEYYTITRNNKNNKIDIYSDEYILDNIITPYFKVDVRKSNLPDNVYDIVIDPGHGGIDSGAIKGNYYESNIVLEHSLELKKQLEQSGLKVKLVRNTDVQIDSYGEEGRAVIPNSVKAKYVFSIHLNSNEQLMTRGGVEIYSPPNANLEFSKLLADNIVNIAKTTYSPNPIFKVEDGIYVRNYTESELKEANNYALQKGYKKYNITTDTPYLFMIRETGGIATNAYIDGRNKNYGINNYYNSNIGVEGYLLELGFMNCKKDLNNILNNKKAYVEAISISIKQYLNILE